MAKGDYTDNTTKARYRTLVKNQHQHLPRLLLLVMSLELELKY